MLAVFWAVVFLNFLEIDALDGGSLNFEHVHFSQKASKHLKDHEVLEFVAFGKKYEALIHPTHPPGVHPHFRVIDSEKKEILTGIGEFYGGHLKGNQSNRILLSRLPSGAYLGYVRDGQEVIHFEPASQHLPESSPKDTLAYKESDIANGRISRLFPMGSPLWPPQTQSYRQKRQHPFYEYVRSQRTVPTLANEKKNRCPLKIVADHRFFQVVGKGDKATTARYIMNTIAKVNEIFQAVNWDEDNEERVENRDRFYNFGFSIKELKIWDRPTEELGHYNGNATENDGVWSSSRLLEAFTRLESSPKFCIVHLITAQSFLDGATLGLAYVATDDMMNGGICSEPRQMGDRIGSYNTLFTSVIGNSGKKDYPLVTREAEIVVAHEYGHTWGAIHDDEKLHEVIGLNETCIPDFRRGGKYIMNSFAQVGFDSNNNRFSPCSTHMIRKMLQRRWNRCFEVEQASLCGNGVIEEGEQCDEGALLPTSSGASCCSRNCTLLPRAHCSPLNMPCCSSSCSFENSSHVCLPQDTWQCKSTSYCTGNSGECPPPNPIEDGTNCADDGECQAGNCVPYCERPEIGKKGCICEELHLSCRRCCRGNNGTGPCLPEEGAPDLEDGNWCVQGYCKNSRCITEVADYVTYYLTAFQDGSTFWKIVRSNIVGLIVMISVPLWCLVSFYITKYDKRQSTIQDREMVFPTYPMAPSSFTMRERTPVMEDVDFF